MTPKNVCIILKYTWCLFQLDNAFQNHLLFANESYEINPQSVHIYLFNIMETTFSLKLSIKSTYICIRNKCHSIKHKQVIKRHSARYQCLIQSLYAKNVNLTGFLNNVHLQLLTFKMILNTYSSCWRSRFHLNFSM